nr:MAG TPA: TIR-like domain protein [Caudoviricetes sp.]
MAKKRVFISFDYTNDKSYKYLLDAWDSNKNLDFVFEDCSADEIMSDNIPTIKAGLTRRINQSDYTLVIVGKEANKIHPDSKEIGYRNWINFEIAQSKKNGNKLVAVKLDKSYESPEQLYSSGASWAMSFTQAAIIKALSEA